MTRILPFEDVEKNERVFQFYRLVNHSLDWPGQDPRQHYDRSAPKRPLCIANHPKFGNISWHGKHRIWFHWGFNTDPRKFPPLVNSLDDAVVSGVIREKDIPEFWILLTNEVSRRNRLLMNEGAKVFGYGELGTISAQQRKQLNAWVTIVYSIHILGDHQTDDVEAMVPLSRLYADIYNAVDNLAGKEPINYEKAKTLKAQLKRCQASPAKFLDAMERHFTPFVLSLTGEGYNYKAQFRKMGYVVKAERSPTR